MIVSPITGAVAPVGALKATDTTGGSMLVVVSLELAPELEAVAKVIAPGLAGAVVSLLLSVMLMALMLLATLFPARSCR